MVVTGVPDPLTSIQNGLEVARTPVISLAVKPKEMPINIKT